MTSRLTRTTFSTGVAVTLALVALCLLAGSAQEGSHSQIDPLYGQLPWRFIGPEGNRVLAVAGVAGDPPRSHPRPGAGGLLERHRAGPGSVSVVHAQPPLPDS